MRTSLLKDEKNIPESGKELLFNSGRESRERESTVNRHQSTEGKSVDSAAGFTQRRRDAEKEPQRRKMNYTEKALHLRSAFLFYSHSLFLLPLLVFLASFNLRAFA
ncbi:hypothetical protein SY85_14730 [Flavisolibacter tropicus]|uniref:Uncharacterized protein n=1 Tax=Flavisolibacter tropicus TaxID=1492898 RepID=A0A172TX62_9BACT|nr:hypothetical protein SY85_14730 [Flavisolibacter tropicus]